MYSSSLVRITKSQLAAEQPSAGEDTPSPRAKEQPLQDGRRTSTGLGKQTLGGHKQNLCAPGARSKEQ